MTAPTLSRNQYEAFAYAFGCTLEIVYADAELLKQVRDNGGISDLNHTLTFMNCPIDKKEFKRLEKRGLVENRGFGFCLSIAGMIQLDIFNGNNPWLGGPIYSYDRAVEKGIVKCPTT